MASSAIMGAVAVAAVGAAPVASRSARRSSPLPSTSPPLRRVAKISEVTATYDMRGNYPAMRLFQIARPLPESSPFGSLPVRLEERGMRQLIEGTYLRAESPYSGLVDQRL